MELLPFVLAGISLWGTPGPNNMMLAYSGATFGLRPTLPHLLGIASGSLLLLSLVLAGLGPLIEAWPASLEVLKVIGSSWLLYIGWTMANAGAAQENRTEKPMTFFAAILFQFVNPKAITAKLALAGILFVVEQSSPGAIWKALVLTPFLNALCISPWLLAGRAIRRFLSTDYRWQLFRWVTGALTAGCAIFLWL